MSTSIAVSTQAVPIAAGTGTTPTKVVEVTPVYRPLGGNFSIVNTAPATTSPPPTTAPAETVAPGPADPSTPTTSAIRLSYIEPTEPPGPVHPQAAEVVAYARSQIGVPYLWGGEGVADGGFDCSGLSLKAWDSIGIKLVHQSQIQWGQTARVAKADLQPGDLVFFGAPIHHLGIYIGDGKMIEAPRTGTTVRIGSINRRDLVGGGRIRWS